MHTIHPVFSVVERDTGRVVYLSPNYSDCSRILRKLIPDIDNVWSFLNLYQIVRYSPDISRFVVYHEYNPNNCHGSNSARDRGNSRVFIVKEGVAKNGK